MDRPALDAMLTRVMDTIRERGTRRGINLVAYSGGVDSTLAAVLVTRVFPDNTRAVLGVSASLPPEQLTLARRLARQGGFRLEEVQTNEGELEPYVANEGMSCFYCKQTLYSTLTRVGQRLLEAMGRGEAPIVLYNGTNADDRGDPTRVGLRAAEAFRVVSPLEALSKREVRALSRHLGLPNWRHAAAPCLRSRLQTGVPATPDNLARVAQAERVLRRYLQLGPEDNLRVRHLAGDVARIELDDPVLVRLEPLRTEVEQALKRLGFRTVTTATFRSGSLSFPV